MEVISDETTLEPSQLASTFNVLLASMEEE
jgi:hypothetical protein